MPIRILLLIQLMLMFSWGVSAQRTTPHWKQLAQPDTVGNWILPAQGKPAAPFWGHKDGIVLSIAPTPGPRGLIRIYCPYLGLDEVEVMNFIAMEPIPKGAVERAYSELEKSKLDKGRYGKRFWSANDSLSTLPQDVLYPARGIIASMNGEETLTFFVFSEPFDNGAKVYVRIRLFASRPYEFEMTTYTYEDSVDLDYFVLSATMGNKARLRTLHLRDKTINSLDLWPDYQDIHFTERTAVDSKEMHKNQEGSIYFIATPDELDYTQAVYHASTPKHWYYFTKSATQYWVKPNYSDALGGILTGRYTYWMSKAPIPGGISIENFELNDVFKQGDSFVFGISPESAEEMIEHFNLQ